MAPKIVNLKLSRESLILRQVYFYTMGGSLLGTLNISNSINDAKKYALECFRNNM